MLAKYDEMSNLQKYVQNFVVLMFFKNLGSLGY